MILIEDFKHKSLCYFNRADCRAVLRALMSDGSSAVILYRVAQFFRKIQLDLIGRVFLEWNKLCNGCVIGSGAQFDPGLVIMHPVGIVINGGVRGGRNIVIESGVVIGAARSGLPVNVPVLGNDIFIGTGAKILGDVKVGNYAKIGANAVVIRDVPDGATVVGIPARVVQVTRE